MILTAPFFKKPVKHCDRFEQYALKKTQKNNNQEKHTIWPNSAYLTISVLVPHYLIVIGLVLILPAILI